MILLLKRAAALVLAAAVVLAAPGTGAVAQEFVRAAPVAIATPGAVAGVSALAPLSLGPSLPAAADGPRASLTPSPWNPAAPTTLLFPAAPKLAPAVGAASMPPLAPAIEAASMPPVRAAVAEKSVVAEAPAADPLAAKTAGAKTYDPVPLSDSKAGRLAQKLASWFRARANAGNGELPPPADAVESLAQAPLDVDPARAYRASPEDWRDETLYPIVVDRFNKGEGAKPYGDPQDGSTRHGGNIRGVIDKLDYIAGSGATTIIVSPLTMSIPEAYHGYAPVHFLAVDPHFGSMADFKELVAKAHEKGLRVVLDWVINHSGPVFEYSDGKTQWTGDGKSGPVEWTRPLKPVELTEEDFSRKRVITDWNDHSQATQGDFPPNYRHFATDRPQTQQKLIHIAQWWMKETDIDGLRLDAVRHVAPGFLPVFSTAIREYAAKLGKKNFLMLGENSTGVDAELKPFIDNGSLDSLYNYPEFRRANYALHGRAPTRDLENSVNAAKSALGEAASRLVRFIDLHDVYRFLLSDTPEGLLKTGLAYAMLSLGIPLVYSGTEQAFRQLHGRLDPEGGDMPADPQNREDMFAGGQYKSESSMGDKFDVAAPGYKFMRALADLRRAYPALRRGDHFTRWSEPGGAGMYAFSRIHEGQEVLVVINTSGEVQEHEMWVDSGVTPPGTYLVDELDRTYEIDAHKSPENTGSRVFVKVPAYGVRVLVASGRTYSSRPSYP
jgi:glycosidase